MDDLLSIGRFARLTGLSVGALRYLADIAEADDREIIERDLAGLGLE